MHEQQSTTWPDYYSLTCKKISTVTDRYRYIPEIKEDLFYILEIEQNPQLIYEATIQYIQFDLKKILDQNVQSIEDEVNCMFQFCEKKLENRIFSGTPMDDLRSEFSNLRYLRSKQKIKDNDFSLNMKRRIEKFYRERYIRHWGN